MYQPQGSGTKLMLGLMEPYWAPLLNWPNYCGVRVCVSKVMETSQTFQVSDYAGIFPDGCLQLVSPVMVSRRISGLTTLLGRDVGQTVIKPGWQLSVIPSFSLKGQTHSHPLAFAPTASFPGEIFSPGDLALSSLSFNTQLVHHLFRPPSQPSGSGAPAVSCYTLCPCACAYSGALVFETQRDVLGKQGWRAIVSGVSSQFLINRT